MWLFVNICCIGGEELCEMYFSFDLRLSPNSICNFKLLKFMILDPQKITPIKLAGHGFIAADSRVLAAFQETHTKWCNVSLCEHWARFVVGKLAQFALFRYPLQNQINRVIMRMHGNAFDTKSCHAVTCTILLNNFVFALPNYFHWLFSSSR